MSTKDEILKISNLIPRYIIENFEDMSTKEIYRAGIKDKNFDYNKGLDALIEKDKDGRWIYSAGVDWKNFDYNKGLDALIEKDKYGEWIYNTGSDWKKFDYNKGFNALIEKDKTGGWICIAGLDWKQFDYNKGLNALIEKDKTGEWIYNAGSDWENFDYNKALKALKGTEYYDKALKDWPKGLEDTRKEIEKLRKTSTELKSKKLKLKEETNMKFSRLLKLFKKAIEYKRKKLEEAKDIESSKDKSISTKDKRKALKTIYKKVLNNTPYEENIPVFMDLIDQVPESYLDYELNINMKNALEIINELIYGEGNLTPDEMANLSNIIAGVGIPAIEKHAAGGKKLGKEAAKFGSEAINKNTEEFLKSLKQRRNPENKLPAPETKDVVSTSPEKGVSRRDFLDKIKKDLRIEIEPGSRFHKTASKLKSKGINVDRLIRSIAGAEKYGEAKENAEKELNRQGYSIEDLKGTDDLFNLFSGLKKKKEEVKVEIKRPSGRKTSE
jgi:hypothetical protein